MPLKVVIVDDEPVARKVIREFVEDLDFLELAGMAENPLKAEALLAEQHGDLIFLDINMPRMSGIEFLRASAGRERQPLVIITTAYAEYALDGFELDVVDYLVKPIAFDRFLKACQKARLRHAGRLSMGAGEEPTPPDHCFVKCGDSLEKIVFAELLYVEAMMNYIVLQTTGKKLIAYLTLKGVLAQLPARHFVQVHKSYVVNRDLITSIRGNTLQLGTATVPISQHYYEAAMQEILKDRVVKRSGSIQSPKDKKIKNE